MPELYTIDELAQKIKEKYPQYKDVDNTELVNRITEKYPQYKNSLKKNDDSEIISPTQEVSSQPSQSHLKLDTGLGEEMKGKLNVPIIPTEQEQRLNKIEYDLTKGDTIGKPWKAGYSNMINAWANAAELTDYMFAQPEKMPFSTTPAGIEMPSMKKGLTKEEIGQYRQERNNLLANPVLGRFMSDIIMKADVKLSQSDLPSGKYATGPDKWTGYLDPKRAYMTLAQNVPLMGSFVAANLANPYFGAMMIGAVEAGQSNDAIKRYEEETGKKVDPDTRAMIVTSVGVINGALEKLGIDAILGKIPGVKGTIAKWLLSTAAEGSTEGLQELFSMIGEEAYNKVPEKDWKRLWDSTYGGILLGFTGGGITTITNQMQSKIEANENKKLQIAKENDRIREHLKNKPDLLDINDIHINKLIEDLPEEYDEKTRKDIADLLVKKEGLQSKQNKAPETLKPVFEKQVKGVENAIGDIIAEAEGMVEDTEKKGAQLTPKTPVEARSIKKGTEVPPKEENAPQVKLEDEKQDFRPTFNGEKFTYALYDPKGGGQIVATTDAKGTGTGTHKLFGEELAQQYEEGKLFIVSTGSQNISKQGDVIVTGREGQQIDPANKKRILSMLDFPETLSLQETKPQENAIQIETPTELPKMEEAKAVQKVEEKVRTEDQTKETWEVGEERDFTFDPNSTTNEGRFRLKPPTSVNDYFQKGAYTIQGNKTDFISRNKFNKQTFPEGIRAVVGKTKDGTEQIQALRFNKKLWPEEKAKQWWNDNKDKYEFYQTETPNTKEVRVDLQPEGQQANLGEETFESAVTRGLNRGIEWLDEVDKQLSKFGKETLGMNLPVAVAQIGVRAAKVTLQAGKTISEAVDSAINAVRESDWYKGLSVDKQKDAENDIQELFKRKPSEIRQKPERVSGIKKELIPEEKIAETEIEKRSVEEIINRGKKLVNEGSINPTNLISEINTNPRVITPEETGALIYHKTTLDNKFDDIYDKLESAKDVGDNDAIMEYQQQLNMINVALDNFHEAALNSGYEQGLSLRMRQALLNSEYNLQSQIRKYKQANNGIIPKDIENKFNEYDRRLKELNKKIKDLENKKSKTGAQDVINDIKSNIKKVGRKKGKDLMAEGFDELMQAIGGKTMALGDKRPSVVSALSKIGIGMIDEGLATIDNVIKKIEDYVKSKSDKKFDISEYKDDLLKEIKSEKEVSFNEDGDIVIPHNLIRDYVEGGISDINDLVSQIKKDFDLELSDREIRDAITKYGKAANLSKEEIEVKIREMKRIGRTLSGLEDVLKEKKRPLRSGLQRDKLTDKERRLQQELREAMKDLPLTDEEVTKSWKSALDAVKTRLRNQIADLQHRIETGERTPERRGIEYDVEANELKEQRDALKDILSKIEGKKEMSEEQKVRIAVANVERLADKYEEKIKNKDFTPIGKKSTLPKTAELTKARQRLSDLKAILSKMKDDLGITEQLRLDRIKTNLRKSIDKYEARIKNKDFAPQKKQRPVLDKEALELEIERNQIKYFYDLEVEKAKIKNRPLGKKLKDLVIDILNLPKSFRASLDFSAPLRQGAILSFAHPKIAAGAFREMFAHTFSIHKAERWLDEVRASDIYIPIKKAGLYLSEPTSKLSAKEEQFMTNIAHRIPIWGKLVSGTERAYVGFLNKLRVDVFAQGYDYLNSIGYDIQKNPEVYKALADFINNAAGRGKLGFAEPVAKELNTAFFSPRLVASRINLLNPYRYAKMPKEVRKMALRDMGLFVGTGMSILAISAAAGADVEEDPRSADFGKIKIGDLRFDIWAGFQQPIRAFVQFVTGQRKSTTTGDISKISKDVFPYDTRVNVLGNFARSKVSPSAGLILDILSGENMLGEDVTPEMIAENTLVPLYLGDISEIYKEEGLPMTSAASVASLFGVGVQYYGERNPVRVGIQEGKSLNDIIKEAKNPEEKSIFGTGYGKFFFKPISGKEDAITKQKEARMRKEYTIYKKFGLEDKNVNFLIRGGINNDEKALYIYEHKKEMPIQLYRHYGIISDELYKKYQELNAKSAK